MYPSSFVVQRAGGSSVHGLFGTTNSGSLSLSELLSPTRIPTGSPAIRGPARVLPKATQEASAVTGLVFDPANAVSVQTNWW